MIQIEEGIEMLAPGTMVEVRTGFDGSWARGFEVTGGDEHGYRVRRLSDGSELPGSFSVADVRRQRRDPNIWWV